MFYSLLQQSTYSISHLRFYAFAQAGDLFKRKVIQLSPTPQQTRTLTVGGISL